MPASMTMASGRRWFSLSLLFLRSLRSLRSEDVPAEERAAWLLSSHQARLLLVLPVSTTMHDLLQTKLAFTQLES